MADILQTLSLLVLAQNYRGDLVRQTNRRSVALSLMPFVSGEGKNVAWAAESTGALAETFSEGADATNFGSDAQASALLSWAEYRANFKISGLAQAASARSRTPEGNLMLWKRNMDNSIMELASKLNLDLFTGAGGNAIVGFDSAIGSVSNTYAGIDRSQGANAYWRPYVVDPGVATPLTFDQIRTDLAAILVQSGMRPDIAFVNPTTYRAIASLFENQKQYMIVTKDVITGRGQVNLEGGVGAISFDGCYFVEDKDATAGNIYYVNSQYVRAEYLPMDLGMVPGMNDEVMAGIQVQDGFDFVPGLALQLEMLAKIGDADKCQMKAYLQLVVDRPNSCGMRKNIA